MVAPVSLASVSELADWIGEPIAEGSADEKRAAQCLRIASVLVRSESGRTWSEPGAVIPEAAVMVALYCAGRVFDNRNAQTRGGLDDYSESWKVDESGAYLTVSEKRMLADIRGVSRGGLGTVSTTRGDFPTISTGYVPTDTPGVEIPWY